MYQLFVETETSFAPDLAGEFKELDDARAAAKQAQWKYSWICRCRARLSAASGAYRWPGKNAE